ncbi:MAG: class I SAM-dependent methyltransferase [Promethearchaeota archaeon]|jgi:ubiquinone/menaquinone biosynthesis C-methylase UbiE
MKSNITDDKRFNLEHHPNLDLYNKLAKSYDRRNSMMEHWISKARSISSLIKGDILEIGAGTGNNLIQYKPEANVVALDWSSEMLSQAKLKAIKYGLSNIKEFIVGDIQNLSNIFEPNSFDYVVSSCVFCSVPDPILGLKQVFKVLKPSGKLIQIEHGISEIKLINVGLLLFDQFTYKRYGFHLNRNHLKNLQNAGFDLIHYHKIDPSGIFRLLISKKLPQKNNELTLLQN